MREILPFDFDFNPFYSFGKEWALIVCEENKEDNAMTISWGNIGILWSKPILSVFVRNTRYTKHMLDHSDKFSCCFFDKKYQNELTYCGTVSRKDEDKITKCNFTRERYQNVLYIKEAKITFILKKIYQVDLPISDSTIQDIKKHYKENECHTQYICEIEKILIEN